MFNFFFIRRSTPHYPPSDFPPSPTFVLPASLGCWLGCLFVIASLSLGPSSRIKHRPYSLPIIVFSDLMCSVPLPVSLGLFVPTLRAGFHRSSGNIELRHDNASVLQERVMGRKAGVFLFLLNHIAWLNKYNPAVLLYCLN
jgi:hypothetical protein